MGLTRTLSQLKDVVEDFSRNTSEDQPRRMTRHTHHRAASGAERNMGAGASFEHPF